MYPIVVLVGMAEPAVITVLVVRLGRERDRAVPLATFAVQTGTLLHGEAKTSV